MAQEDDVILEVALRPVANLADYAGAWREVGVIGVILPLVVRRGGTYGRRFGVSVQVHGK